ncbi:MAG: hypothetical protein J6J04_05525 [Oscillospiraceae bacterium]|nr:hypothetical protein [Oscillospiraceae bacterium]
MEQNSTARTVGYVVGIGVLLFVLFLVVCIMTGVLPWRDSADSQPPTHNMMAEDLVTPSPTPTPTPSPAPTPEAGGELTPPPAVTTTPNGSILDEELPTYTITVTYSKGGSAIPYGMNSVVENGLMTIEAVPDDGYAVESMIVDGVNVGAMEVYTLENVTSNHTVYISFARTLFAPTPTPEVTPTPVLGMTNESEGQSIPQPVE